MSNLWKYILSGHTNIILFWQIKNLIKKYCKDANVVHHLAGITNVPKTKNETSLLQDEKIKEVGEKGTQNILDVISDDCKIIFPSTHVVYEGINEVKINIKEKVLGWYVTG